jgi:peptidoglycan/LPS O-acetylase OafA/YrhL
MIGYLKFSLAFFVLITHIQFEENLINGSFFDISNSSLIAFYFLSGYLLTNSIKLSNYKSIINFYISRFFKIFPLYILIILLFLLLDNNYKSYNFRNLFIHLSIIGEFLFDSHNYRERIIPVIWSVKNELIYYALLPLILLFDNKLLLISLIFSYLIFVFYFVFNLLNIDILFYNDFYHSLSFGFFYFIFGAFLASKKEYNFLSIFIFYVTHMLLFSLFPIHYHQNLNINSIILGGSLLIYICILIIHFSNMFENIFAILYTTSKGFSPI